MNTTIKTILGEFFKHYIQLKMFHFQTTKYGAHKASDTYLDKFTDTYDKFMEVAQGKFGKLSINELNIEKFKVVTDDTIFNELKRFIILLESLNDSLNTHTDLLNIRDEMLGNVNQLKYLLTFN